MATEGFDAFMGLSEYLMGVPIKGIDNLDPQLGMTYFERLRQYLDETDTIDSITGSVPTPTMGETTLSMPQTGPSTLADLLAIWRQVGANKEEFDRRVFLDKERPDLSELAQKILILWYSAQIDNVPLDATTYDRAMVWTISYAHPQGVPRSFGYWQYSPEAVGIHNPPGIGGEDQ